MLILLFNYLVWFFAIGIIVVTIWFIDIIRIRIAMNIV